MIEFSQDGMSVRADIKVSDPHDHTSRLFHLYGDAGSNWAADLLVKVLNKALRRRIMASRQSSYEQGWKDAKAKRQKETLFTSWLDKE